MAATTNDAALLLLDLQNDLVHPDGKMGAAGLPKIVAERRVLDNAAAAIDAARSAGVPIVYVGLSYREDYADVLSVAPRIAKMKESKLAVRGSFGAQFHEKIAPGPEDIVFYKQCVNPFFGTNLHGWLARHGIRRLFVGGVATNLAVESAARFADDAGFAVTVMSDCCASPNPAWHDFAITNILPVFGRVLPMAEAMASLKG